MYNFLRHNTKNTIIMFGHLGRKSWKRCAHDTNRYPLHLFANWFANDCFTYLFVYLILIYMAYFCVNYVFLEELQKIKYKKKTEKLKIKKRIKVNIKKRTCYRVMPIFLSSANKFYVLASTEIDQPLCSRWILLRYRWRYYVILIAFYALSSR